MISSYEGMTLCLAFDVRFGMTGEGELFTKSDIKKVCEKLEKGWKLVVYKEEKGGNV